ncbi:MAG: hypothetical protein RR325_04060 [Bacilli bacterium]
MKKWMIIVIIIVYAFLIGLLIYYKIDNDSRKDKLKKKVEILEVKLEDYYNNKYDAKDLGKIFLFPGETNVKIDENGIISGEAFIYGNGKIEIALYDGKYCAYKLKDLEIKKASISTCVTNRKEA